MEDVLPRKGIQSTSFLYIVVNILVLNFFVQVLDGSLVLNSKTLNYKQFYRMLSMMRQYGCLEVGDHKPRTKNQVNAIVLAENLQ